LQGNVNTFAKNPSSIMMDRLFRGTLRNHLGHHLTALREENARVLRATLVGNRIVVAYKWKSKSAISSQREM
jgi:hypothetical protein